MRKKLLRSRSGFEKPESREEAIMQNILGASNVLEPSESNIEEILKSILYNTPYTKEAEFEIEKILLAIKNNGTYDGKGESRDMKILIAILNDLDYTEEAESRIEELFIEWLQQRSQIKVLEGVPPLTFTANGTPLLDYLISGNTVQSGTPTSDSPIMPQGTGERTGNLLDYKTVESTTYATATQISDGISVSGRYYVQFRTVEFAVGNTYTMSWKANTTSGTSSPSWRFHYADNTYSTMEPSGGTLVAEKEVSEVLLYVSTSASCIVEFKEIMLNLGSTPLPYEPYGYIIPITCGGVTTDIYIGDSPLYDGDTISMTDTGIEIPTAYGNNVLTVDTTVQPSNVYIEYK